MNGFTKHHIRTFALLAAGTKGTPDMVVAGTESLCPVGVLSSGSDAGNCKALMGMCSGAGAQVVAIKAWVFGGRA